MDQLSNSGELHRFQIVYKTVLLQEAAGEAAAIRARAQSEVAQERRKAVNEAKNEIGGIAMEIAGKVIEREISEEDHRKLIEEFIENVGEAS